MAEHLHPQPATDAAGFIPGPLGLRLDEAFLPITALRGRPDVLDRLLPLGHYRQAESTLSLRFWPHMIWHSGAVPDGAWQKTDISHGLIHLQLRGVEALHFLAHYTTADVQSVPLRQARAVRTKLNHYDCAIWWANTRDVHLMTDRSLAQSLCDHLRTLARRHNGAETLQTVRPVAPDAPDRRG